MRDMKVLIAPVETAGFVANLVQGLRQLGVDAESYVSERHSFSYDVEEEKKSLTVRLWRHLGTLFKRTPPFPFPVRVALLAAQSVVAWFVLFRSVRLFDAYIFVAGKTFTNTRFELRLLHFLGKKIIFVSLGSESRPPYMSGGYSAGMTPAEAAPRIVRASRKVAKTVQLQERYAHYVVNAPGTGQFHRKNFVNWFSMGVPVPEAQEPSLEDDASKSGPVRILHSPSKPLLKGSNEIRAVIASLKRKGYAIDFIELKGVPNAKVREELARCDFVIDQLYSDTPMAFFATEAAHYGKPAVVGGYFSAFVNQYVDRGDIPPSAYVLPEQLEETVARLIDDRRYRIELGSDARRFVRGRWHSRIVAQRYLRLLNDEVPDSWLCSPENLSYLGGVGVSEKELKAMVRYIFDHYGWEAFQLKGKPALEASLTDLLSQQPADENA
tara:strand:- start:1521 stop:2837 length:1317 start_codon:yes stop_codon:yes gene_type:complete